MIKKYLIFDLDGTLINSVSKWGMGIAEKHVKKINKDLADKARYIFSTTPWMPIYKQLEKIFEWENISYEEIRKIWNDIYDIIRSNEDNYDFYPWVIKMIKKLSKDYTLFLTTWSWTKYAKEMLDKWWIKKYFELVFWSNKIPKWHLHLETFMEYSWDPDFYKSAVYIWDWEMDRIFANEMWIDFVHVWETWIDEHEIDKTKKLIKILKEFN